MACPFPSAPAVPSVRERKTDFSRTCSCYKLREVFFFLARPEVEEVEERLLLAATFAADLPPPPPAPVLDLTERTPEDFSVLLADLPRLLRRTCLTICVMTALTFRFDCRLRLLERSLDLASLPVEEAVDMEVAEAYTVAVDLTLMELLFSCFPPAMTLEELPLLLVLLVLLLLLLTVSEESAPLKG